MHHCGPAYPQQYGHPVGSPQQYGQPVGYPQQYGRPVGYPTGFALIIVLFILLIIVGAGLLGGTAV